MRILGRRVAPRFPIYHRVLGRAKWSSRAVAGRLLRLLVAAFVPAQTDIVIGLDDTVGRRWGRRSTPAASIAILSDPPTAVRRKLRRRPTPNLAASISYASPRHAETA
ncbi:hypothetical protein [Mesorhizobium sp.]|uniref:hypothetical protein n=1 Tax=Mesorhizobium sp. TaxID=1871066 RepID=UPI00257A8BAB|nr:hypothetical protein [Mesorhizobium sp.]